MTKLAMLKLTNCEEWNQIGGRILISVHDELICEVPMEHWKRGGELLSQMMVEAGSFLPFSVKCDVTTTLRWYGEAYPITFTKPQSLDTVEPDEVKWIQCCLREMEYLLPVYPGPDGKKPSGVAAHGINGVVSDEYDAAIQDYIKTRNITPDKFIETIEKEVLYRQ